MRTSGHWVLTSGRTPLLARKRSATASFTRRAAKFRLLSGLCWAVTFDLEALAWGEPDFPGHAAGQFVKVVFAAIGPVRQLYQHALRKAAVQVEQQRIAPGGAQQHATAPGEQVLTRQAGGTVGLIGQKALDASGAGQKNLELVHRQPPRIRPAPVEAGSRRCRRPQFLGGHGSAEQVALVAATALPDQGIRTARSAPPLRPPRSDPDHGPGQQCCGQSPQRSGRSGYRAQKDRSILSESKGSLRR
jgi:hypothetical protein